MKAREASEATDNMEGNGAPQRTRKVQDEEEEVRGDREAKFQWNLRQVEEKRRAQKQTT